ncbi:MAG: sigma-70 family RNA polymerase sigma factor [Chryseobacterium sp.]|nr:MAG: sigma-70 family RNA polymerase sigma factor [Chryseobacterium sp.]
MKGKELSGYWDSFIVDGNDEAFYILYSHYHNYFTFVGLQKGVSQERVKDCINDVFLSVFEKRTELSHILNHHNYLVTVFIRKLFKKDQMSGLDSLETLNLEEIPSYPSADSQFILRNTTEHVAKLLKLQIDKLSYSQAQMVYQKFYLGLTYEELSKANSITVKTAYNTIYNAVERLKKEISKEQLEALGIFLTLLVLIFIFFF